MPISSLGTGDRELTVRIAVALAVLFAATAAFVALGFLALEGALLFGEIDATPVTRSLLVILGTTVALLLVATGYGYRRTLARVDAEPLERSDRPELYAAADRLAAIVDVPTPRLAVVDTDVPNALAVGRPSAATIVLSSGLLEALDARERDAVLAHEIAHVANYDAVVMELAGALAGITDSIVAGSRRLREWAGTREDPGEIFVLGLLSVVTFVIAAPFWFCARTVHRFCSQYRELVADRTAAAMTGDPAALASALSKLEESTPPLTDVRVPDGTQAMCILPNEFELVAVDADEGWDIENIDLNWESASPSREASAPTSNLKAARDDLTASSVDWERVEVIERRRQSQPLYGVDHRELVTHERVLQFPDTHPPVSTRREQLQEIQRTLEGRMLERFARGTDRPDRRRRRRRPLAILGDPSVTVQWSRPVGVSRSDQPTAGGVCYRLPERQ